MLCRKKTAKKLNRRNFLQNSALATMGLTAGTSAARGTGRKSANEKIIVGCIGLGLTILGIVTNFAFVALWISG